MNSELLSLLGTYRSKPLGTYRGRCPLCRKQGRDTALSIRVERDQVRGHCFRCEGWAIYRDEPRIDAHPLPPPAPAAHRTLSPYGRDLWAQSLPLGGEALAYLQARQCVLPPSDGDLRWHPQLRHAPTGYEGPALVALVTDALTGEPISVHRTWVKGDGSKATDPARLLLKDHRKAGGVIRLWPDEAVTLGLAISEGIETALSVAYAYRPVWAAIDAGNLASFPVLDGIEALLIAADADPKGRESAEHCARRWSAAGREVRLIAPETGDANDLLRCAA